MVATSTQGLIKRLGPGVITGAADDDPSGIATYSQAGAHAGFGLLWTVVLTWPLMVAVQSVSARIGRVTADARCFVQLRTQLGGRRMVDWLAAEQLPRIC